MTRSRIADAPNDRQDVADRVPDRVEHAGDELGVVRGARDQLAGADAVVVAGVELEGAPEDPVAHVGVGQRAVPDREVVAGAAGDRLDRAEGHERRRRPTRAPSRSWCDDARVDRRGG